MMKGLETAELLLALQIGQGLSTLPLDVWISSAECYRNSIQPLGWILLSTQMSVQH